MDRGWLQSGRRVTREIAALVSAALVVVPGPARDWARAWIRRLTGVPVRR